MWKRSWILGVGRSSICSQEPAPLESRESARPQNQPCTCARRKKNRCRNLCFLFKKTSLFFPGCIRECQQTVLHGRHSASQAGLQRRNCGARIRGHFDGLEPEREMQNMERVSDCPVVESCNQRAFLDLSPAPKPLFPLIPGPIWRDLVPDEMVQTVPRLT